MKRIIRYLRRLPERTAGRVLVHAWRHQAGRLQELAARETGDVWYAGELKGKAAGLIMAANELEGWLNESRQYTEIERVYATRIDALPVPG